MTKGSMYTLRTFKRTERADRGPESPVGSVAAAESHCIRRQLYRYRDDARWVRGRAIIKLRKGGRASRWREWSGHRLSSEKVFAAGTQRVGRVKGRKGGEVKERKRSLARNLLSYLAWTRVRRDG